MIRRPRATPVPMELPLALRNGKIVDTGMARAHQPARIELPILIAVGAEPVARVVMPLIGEAAGDTVLAPGPDLLDEAIVELLRQFPLQEIDDRGPPLLEPSTAPQPAHPHGS